MINFNRRFEYDDNMDVECINLCDALNALPGIETRESCCGHSCSPFTIYFRVTDEKGLAFLTRCVDHRYWKYGYLWRIWLTIGDTPYEDGHRPITYILTSDPIVGEDAYAQAQSLIDNMNDHLNIPAFLELFDLSLDDFDILPE